MRKKSGELRSFASGKKVLIVYNPDPFYNLDEQICLSARRAFLNEGMNVKVATVAANGLENLSFDQYVFCANTYNSRPD